MRRWVQISLAAVSLLALAIPAMYLLPRLTTPHQDALVSYAQVVAALGTALAALAAFAAASSSESASLKAQAAAETAERAMALHDAPGSAWHVKTHADGDDLVFAVVLYENDRANTDVVLRVKPSYVPGLPELSLPGTPTSLARKGPDYGAVEVEFARLSRSTLDPLMYNTYGCFWVHLEASDSRYPAMRWLSQGSIVMQHLPNGHYVSAVEAPWTDLRTARIVIDDLA